MLKLISLQHFFEITAYVSSVRKVHLLYETRGIVRGGASQRMLPSPSQYIPGAPLRHLRGQKILRGIPGKLQHCLKGLFLIIKILLGVIICTRNASGV